MGRIGFAMLGVYSATKFAVRALTQAATKEFAADGITRQRLLPRYRRHRHVGGDRPAVRRNQRRPGRSDIQQVCRRHCALGRAQTPEDVAAFVAYLAGPASDYMTGQAPLIDGGIVYR